MSGIIDSGGSRSGIIGTTELEYEYGIWTGTITDLTNNTGMDNNQGTYVRIGNMVTAMGYFLSSGLGSASGSVYLSGLPFTSNVISSGSCSYGTGYTITAGSSVALRIPANQAYVILDLWDAVAGTSQMQFTEWTSDGRIQINIVYTIGPSTGF